MKDELTSKQEKIGFSLKKLNPKIYRTYIKLDLDFGAFNYGFPLILESMFCVSNTVTAPLTAALERPSP